MKEYEAKSIKNVIILGHLGSGKTSLTESLIFTSGGIEKKGEVEKKNTVSDFTIEEQTRMASLSTAIVPVEFKTDKINFLDAPGADEFIGDISYAMKAASGAILVLDATKGVEVGAEKMWKEIRKNHLPAIVFINKMDKENVKFDEILDLVRTKLGKQAVPFCLPIGKQTEFKGFADIIDLKARIYDGQQCVDGEIYPDKLERVQTLRQELVETVAGADEDLLEKYFNGEELTIEEIKKGMRLSVISGEAVPIMVGAATKNIGVLTLLHMIHEYFPTMAEGGTAVGIKPDTEEKIERKCSDDEPFSAFIFKTLIDPFVGTINIMHIKSGTLKKDQEIFSSTSGDSEKVGQLFLLSGKTQLPVEVVHAGDICAVAKMTKILSGSTLSDKKNLIVYDKPITPSPTMYVAIKPKNKADEDKLSNALAKLQLEDGTFEIRRNKETNQLLIGGQGIIHIGYIIDKMKNMFKVDVEMQDQDIVYRETIKGTATAEGRYVKQSGGSGYYGVVVMRFEPLADKDYEFDEEVFGGSVPRNYFPAVDKGLQDTLEHGLLAGFPVIGVKGILTDGKYHPVDSNEMAFKMAASLAWKEACPKAKPIILEPIYKIEVVIKDAYLGDVLGDVNKRRGRVLGMEPADEGYQKVVAEVPEAEITKYTIDLKAMTQGSGTFSRTFLRYEEVPGNLTAKIIEEHKKPTNN
ncbi:MAG: elongation factor G [Candidatus Izemoplasmatales bacterium]|jgi:elongation factor G|nr:elongation factor G [Candidatus Izemoplasmatales bacterium]MDD3865831.1 elongation factor G [Candidatus Izemoplasmatales bacterium]